MINAVGREIPEEILKKTGKEPFKGAYAYDNHEYKKAAPTVRALCDPGRSKMVENIHEALVKCGIRDGMTLSFHHHFREGDYVVNMVMETMSSRMVWLMSSMFALHAARVVATAATMPLRSLPKTEMTHFMNGSFL